MVSIGRIKLVSRSVLLMVVKFSTLFIDEIDNVVNFFYPLAMMVWMTEL